MSGVIGASQVSPVNAALAGLDKVIADDQTYRPDAFLTALEAADKVLPLGSPAAR
jgi:hypothetical protein